MRIQHTYILLLFWQIMPFYITAQIGNLRFEKLDAPDVPSFPNIDVIYQDSRGFMWFGSYAGLYMFDGYTFSHFQHNTDDTLSISDNKIRRIIEDEKGNFWVGTQNGLNYFDIRKRSFKRYNDKAKFGIGITYINKIKQDKHKNIWVAASDGLYRMDSAHKKCQSYFFNTIVSSMELSDSGVYALTPKGVHFKGNKSDNFDFIKILPVEQPKWNDQLIMMLKDDNGILWIGSRYGLFYINTLQNSLTISRHHLFKNELIRHIVKKSKIELWIETKKGFYMLNTQTLEFERYRPNPLFPESYTEKKLFNLYHSQANNILWVQTIDMEVKKVVLNKQQFQHIPFTLMDYIPSIPNLFEMYDYSPNTLLIRHRTGAVFLDINTRKTTPFTYQPNYNVENWQSGVICFFEQGNGKLWIGTDKGLFLFNKNTQKFTNLEAQIKDFSVFRKTIPRKIYRDKNGYLWVATWGTGVYKVDFSKKTIKNYLNTKKDSSQYTTGARSILEDKKGNIWVGTRGGLCKYIEEADSFKIYRNDINDPKSMSENTAFCIYEDKEDNIWVGTYGGGLNKLDVKKEVFKHYTTKNGLLNNNVFGILPDSKDNLWLLGYDGISVYNPNTDTFQVFKKTNGLLNEKYEAFLYGKSRFTNRFYFAGTKGIDFFNPDSIKLSTLDPHVYITDFKLFNKTVPISKGEKDTKTFYLNEDISFTKHLTLAYEQNVIGFEFAALDYSAPKNIQYAYILEDFDKNWQFIGNNRSATFTNLNPGDYTFKVKATNGDGVWGTKIASLKLTVLAPWWQTWWFRSLVFITLASIGFAFYQYRISQIKEREAIKTTLNKRIAEVKMEALRSQMNPHFIFNALTSINLFILKNDTETASFYLNKFSRLMREVLDHSRSDLITVEEELNTLKTYIEIEKMRFRNAFNFDLDVQPTARISTIQVPPLIIQPYVENAIWHGLKHKKDGDAILKIAIFEDSEYFYIIVEDNGVGRTKTLELKKNNTNQHTSHGLNVTEERIKQYSEAHFVEASVETIDLMNDNQQPIGTRIVFKIKTLNFTN